MNSKLLRVGFESFKILTSRQASVGASTSLDGPGPYGLVRLGWSSDTLPCIARGMAHFYTATGLHETLRVTALVRKVDENVGLTSLVNLNLRYYGCCAARYPLVNVVSYAACLSMLSFVSIFTGNISDSYYCSNDRRESH